MEYSPDQVKSILRAYEKKRHREKDYYQRVKKHDEEYQKENRARAKAHYAKNKGVKKENYEKNKELIKARQLFYYYSNRDKLDVMKERYPDKIKLLISKGLLSPHA